MANSRIVLKPGWAREVLTSEATNKAVDDRAQAIAQKAQAVAGVDASGEKIRVHAEGGSRERTRARAFVRIDHPAAADLEGARSILGRSV